MGSLAKNGSNFRLVQGYWKEDEAQWVFDHQGSSVMSGKERLLACAFVATALLLGIALSEPDPSDGFHSYIPSISRVGASGPSLPTPDMITYEDPQSGFTARVPSGWQRRSWTEPGEIGFTVSFESPPSDSTDEFSDYLMVDIQPDRIPAAFDKKPDERVSIHIDGHELFAERVSLKNYPVRDTTLNLVVWRLLIEDAQHTIAVHAVGEAREDARLERIILDFAYSFELIQSPFQVSLSTH